MLGRSLVMASKDISSYFSKPAASASTSNSSSSTSRFATGNGTKRTADSSPVKKPSGLPTAMQQAILDGAREAKRAKVDDSTGDNPLNEAEPVPTAPIFGSAPTASPAKTKINLPDATTKHELIHFLDAHPHKKELLQLELDTLGEDWLLALQDELTKPYFLSLKEFVTKEQQTKKVFPPPQDIYSWSRLCKLRNVRVVIVGQDPYHDDGQAHGFAFSVRKGLRIPPSLRNIYKEMSDEIPDFTIPKHGDLTEWAKHGVLLLNTSLTVRAHEAGSHSNRGWESFTAAVLRVITSRLTPTEGEGHIPGAHGVVFMAWGKHAQTMCAGIDKKKHLLLQSAHPSPFAAMKGFFGNGHFKKANVWLEERYGPSGGIDWAALGPKA